ncbi:hypothetical protein N8341_02385 [Flavobacteriaceae bacterium]|nr:hypothetical protein [Flavobacteriaceae bacterium]
MKFYKLIFAFFLSTLLHAQYDLTTVGNDPAATNSSGMWIVNNASAAKIQGTFYLLEDWVSKGYLTRIDGKVVTVLGLNYDTKSDAFVVKVSNDSIFKFNDTTIKEVNLGNMKFRRYSNVMNAKQSYLEVLANTNDIEILKYHGKQIKLGVKNPMTQASTPDKYVDVKRVFFKKGNKVTETKLSKKQFYKLFDDKSNLIKAYVSKNRMSLKDDKNLQKILNYYNTL